jgi:hypothetical protein
MGKIYSSGCISLPFFFQPPVAAREKEDQEKTIMRQIFLPFGAWFSLGGKWLIGLKEKTDGYSHFPEEKK